YGSVYQLVSLTLCVFVLFFFFFNDPATTEIYTLSLHDAFRSRRRRRSGRHGVLAGRRSGNQGQREAFQGAPGCRRLACGCARRRELQYQIQPSQKRGGAESIAIEDWQRGGSPAWHV